MRSKLDPPSTTSLTFRLRLPKVIRELEEALREASEGSWEAGDRERACEIAAALSKACRIEKLREPAVVAKSLASLMRLSAETIRPIEPAFREKARELLESLKGIAHRVLTGSDG